MTELSDELLVAYVDGQLAREQSRAVDKVLEQDEVIAHRVNALKEAHDRLESAFEAILAGEVSEAMAAMPSAPPRSEPRGNGLAKVGLATAGVGLALAALVAGYGWPLVIPDLITLGHRAPQQQLEPPVAVATPPADTASGGYTADLARGGLARSRAAQPCRCRGRPGEPGQSRSRRLPDRASDRAGVEDS